MTNLNTEEGHVYFVEYRCVDKNGWTLGSFDHKNYAVHFRLNNPDVDSVDIYHHYGTRKNPLEIKHFKNIWHKPRPKAYIRQKPQRS